MDAIQIISQDLFDKIRSRFTNLEMGDETGAVTIDPFTARFFDFDFVSEGVNLGRVSISLNDLGKLKIFYSQGITENQDDFAKKMWYNFLKEMRKFSMRRLLRFDTRDIAKSNLDKNDFQFLATNGPKDEATMNMNESRWNSKNSKKTSRAVKGATEVIVRHHNPVDEMFPASRSRRNNIKAIFIQNKDGERFKYPFIHPAGAFAMAQHVDHGGIPHDPAGKAIIKMSEQIAQLQEFQRQVQRSTLHDDAMGITERAIGRLNELKKRVEALSKRHHYESWINEFNETEHNDDLLSELDPVTFEEYKSKFTQNSFNEELGKLFPLLHSIMQEKIELDEYISDSTENLDTSTQEDIKKESFISQFDEWVEAVEQGKLTDDQIETLKTEIENLPSGKLELGPEGQVAWQFFSGLGIEDLDLQEKLKDMANIDDSTDALEVFKAWATDNYPEILVALGMSSDEAEQPPAEQPPAEQPVAEAGEKSMFKEIATIIDSRFNKDNPDVGPFNGHEGILIDVEKSISEKFGEAAGKKARMVAEKYMEKLTAKWQHLHGESADVDEVQQRNFTPHSDLAGRGRMPNFNKTPDGQKKEFDRGTDRLKDKMKFTRSMGGVAGPKGDLPEMTDIKRLAGLKK